jgi:spermidine synthase
MMKRPLGDLVMSDTGDELESHLDFMMRAHGDVLVTGLGLGCVARGCLANPFVKRVTVIEKDSCVLRLVAPHMPRDPRLRIVHADALQYVDVLCSQPLVRQFDCAWHDLWADDDDENGKALQLMHACMIRDLVYANRVTHFQGGWNLPRWFRRGLRRKFGPSIL